MPEPSLPEESIFGQAFEIESVAERAAFLDRACVNNPALRAEVEALLRAHEDSGDLLDFRKNNQLTIDLPACEGPGTVIGPYKLLEQIGEGGMGTVWMAEQTEPIQRRVAVKVVKEGMDSRQVLARFEAERQALALMEHPNIAKVLDAGKTPSGRPYFVMELVKGQPITKYCDEKRVGVRERLELFGDVCRAVQHAHQKGIIHRDLKPSNVLVAPYDGKPVVKVIDFGVAKATGQRLTDKTLFTGFGALVGTPEYMSPEQAETNNQDIDTRSDIYSLGVLLYELLTGSTPLTRQRIKEAALLEVLRVIREEEPPKPSTRLSTTEELPSIAAKRGLEPRKLSGLVRGELDWIVMKALEKDRNRRYETANGFAMDVQRYLADEPVQACPPSAGYRFRKFARRNKRGLAVVGTILFFLVLLVSGAGWIVRDRGVRQANLAGQVESIFSEVDRLEVEQKWPEALVAARRAEAAVAGSEGGAQTTERVRQGLKDLEFIDRLEGIRVQRSTVVEGKFDDAGANREYARAFRDHGVDVEELPVEMSIDRLKARPALAIALASALDDWAGARFIIAEKNSAGWKRLLALAHGIDPDPLRDRLRSTWGQPVSSELQDELRRVAHSIDIRSQQPATLAALASILLRAKVPDAGVQLLQEAQHVYPGDFWLNYLLCRALFERRDFKGVTRFCMAAVAIRPKSANAHVNLGYALRERGELDEAIAECRRAVELDPKIDSAHVNLGNCLKDLGKLDEAIAEYRKAIELNPKSAIAYGNLGAALHDLKKLDEALVAYRKAIEIDPKLANAHANFGSALGDLGKFDEAVVECRKAVDLDPKSASARSNLGHALIRLGTLDEAVAQYRKAIELDPKYAIAQYNLGHALSRLEKPDEAIVCFRKAIELDPKFADAHNSLGWELLCNGQVDDAIAEFREALRHKKDFALARNNLREAERMAELTKRLPAVVEGKRQPRDNTDRLGFARLCLSYRKEYAAAARFYAEAFAVEPKLAEDLKAHNRYNAACAAALAGCGKGKDATELDDEKRAGLRRQALNWLRADLQACDRLLDKEPDKVRPIVVAHMRHCLDDADFASVRGPRALAKLPEAERQPWQKHWDNVANTLARAQAKSTPERKLGAKKVP